MTKKIEISQNWHTIVVDVILIDTDFFLSCYINSLLHAGLINRRSLNNNIPHTIIIIIIIIIAITNIIKQNT